MPELKKQRDGQPGSYAFEIFSIKPPTNRGNYLLDKTFAELSVYEDIFSPNGITGSIAMNDALNKPMYVPIVGEELINLHIDGKIKEDDETILKFKRQFNTSGVSSQRYVSTNQQVYKINFHCSLLDANRVTRVCKYYDDSASNIVKDILT